jgi:hypothetical protein
MPRPNPAAQSARAKSYGRKSRFNAPPPARCHSFCYICDNGTYIARYDDLVDGKDQKIDVSKVDVSMNGIELQDREFFAAIREKREPNASVHQVLPCDRTRHEPEERHKLSWWDSLVVAAAQLRACTVLLTEALQDGCAYGTVTVLNQFTTGVAEARASYESAPVAVRRVGGRSGRTDRG